MSEPSPSDLTLDGSALPLPCVLVVDGLVVSADEAARAWGPGTGSACPFEEWFDPRDVDQVADALSSTRKPAPIVRMRASGHWVALHARPTGRGDEVLVMLRRATDEQYLRAAVDAVADSTFVIDAAGANRWRSARLRERSGLSDRAAAQQPAGERIHPEDLPVVFEAFAAAGPERPATVVVRSRAVDDDDRWETIEITVWNRVDHEVLDGYLVQVRNLDEGRTLTTALSEADPQLLSLTEAAPVGIMVTDPAGQIVYRNPVARSLLGPDLQSFGDAEWVSLGRPEDRAELTRAFRAGLVDGVPTEVTAEFQDASGEARWLRLRVVPQRSADGERTKGVIATIEDVTEPRAAQARLVAAEEQMRHLALHDALTGLPNRAALATELERAVARHARTDAGLAVLFCDLDGFKPLNDNRGHAGGDEVLVAVARRLREAVREADFVARFGGDEFVVLCESTGSDHAVVERVAARLHDLVEQPIDDRGVSVTVSLSVGVALVGPGTHVSPDHLLLRSDQAMYEVKAEGPGGTRAHWAHP